MIFAFLRQLGYNESAALLMIHVFARVLSKANLLVLLEAHL